MMNVDMKGKVTEPKRKYNGFGKLVKPFKEHKETFDQQQAKVNAYDVVKTCTHVGCDETFVMRRTESRRVYCDKHYGRNANRVQMAVERRTHFLHNINSSLPFKHCRVVWIAKEGYCLSLGRVRQCLSTIENQIDLEMIASTYRDIVQTLKEDLENENQND